MLNPQLSDGLFLERLDAFMEKTLNDVQAFAVREDRTFEEVRTNDLSPPKRLTFSP